VKDKKYKNTSRRAVFGYYFVLVEKWLNQNSGMNLNKTRRSIIIAVSLCLTNVFNCFP
jgi:hypothetical protein